MDFIFMPTVIFAKRVVWVPVHISIRVRHAIMVGRLDSRVLVIQVISEM
jgi:hypothetical protein